LRIAVNFKYILSIAVFMKYVITLRGERDLWLDFVHKVRKDKKKVWDILNPYLRKYISSGQNTRVLLILFPKDLVDQLLAKDDPDGFVEEAIRHQLLKDR
jgi:hypothetical protein